VEEVSEFCELMSRIRDGDAEAMEQVCLRYSDAIRHVVRRKLRQRLRTQYDSVDFVQAVWASVVGVPREDFHFETPADLVRFLARLATHKVIDAYRQRRAQKNYCEREVPLESPSALPGREPTPSQNAIAGERLQKMIDALTPAQRRILALRRQGHTHQEIADQLGIDVKTVQRILSCLERNLRP